MKYSEAGTEQNRNEEGSTAFSVRTVTGYGLVWVCQRKYEHTRPWSFDALRSISIFPFADVALSLASTLCFSPW